MSDSSYDIFLADKLAYSLRLRWNEKNRKYHKYSYEENCEWFYNFVQAHKVNIKKMNDLLNS